MENAKDPPPASSRSNDAFFLLVSKALHELSQPLTVLQGSLELALLKAKNLEEHRDALETGLEQSERLSGLVRILRELTEAERNAGQAHKVFLGALLRSIADDLKPLAEERGRILEADCEEDLPVLAVARCLHHALLTLLSHAVTVEQPTAGVRASLKRSGDKALLVIRILAPLPSGQQHGTLEQPAQSRVRNSYSAEELRISIARRILEIAGGTAHVASTPDADTFCRIHLPIAAH